MYVMSLKMSFFNDMLFSPLSAANVTLEESVYMVNESDVYVMVCAVLTEGVLERDITVYLSTSDGTALAPDDYTAIANSPLTFFSGDPVDTRRCVNVTIIDEEIVEDDQFFSVSLTSSDPVYITPFSEAQVVISDNDRKLIEIILIKYGCFKIYYSPSSCHCVAV